MDNQLFEKVAKQIESYRDDFITLQRKLISTPAIGPTSGGKGEMEKFKVLEPLLREISDELITDNAPDERVPAKARPNVMARLKGKSSKSTTWIMAHMDVVPAGDEKLWSTPPFEAIVKDGKIFGRGAEDNHHGLCAGFFAIKALKQLGITPANDVCLLLISDEETQNESGITYLLKKNKYFKKEDIFVVPDSGDEKGQDIEIAEKHVIWLKFTTKGKQSHGAYPHLGNNACRAAAYLVVEMDKLRGKYSKQDSLFGVSPVCTMEPTKRLANVPNYNTIPGEDISGFDCRMLPHVNTDEFLIEVKGVCKIIEKRFGVTINVDVDNLMPASYTPPDAPVVKRIQTAAKAVYSVNAKPVGIGGATVASFLRQNGFQAACYGKFFEMAHQPNEFTLIDNMIGDAKVFAHVILQD